MIYTKNCIQILIVFLLLFCKEMLAESKGCSSSMALKASLQALYDYQDLYKEDRVLQEIYVLSNTLYKKIIELIALYYCKHLIVDADVLYDKILADINKDAIRIIKLLTQYIPLLCKNKKISWKIKAQKLAAAGCVMAVSIVWVRTFYVSIVDENTKSVI